MSFKELGLGENVLKAIEECGYTEPTPIQKQAIPIVLMTRDVVGLAQTGTGKTAGFTLPMIEILSGGRAKARMPRSLILEPTRELAAQVAQNFDTYGKYSKLSKALLVGGESMDEQIKILERGADVLIATPGRLLDLFDRGRILLTDIRILVIDEADRMLDMGFIPDIEKIVSKLPPIRQTLLFSATMPPEIKKLTHQFLSNPKEISVAPPASPAETVKQFLVYSHPKNKREALEKIIEKEDVQNAFIFCNRKRDVDILAKYLAQQGYSAKGMHGDMTQSIRTQTLADFKAGKITLLVCSDVAARGLDIKGLSHVFNFDVPNSPDDYVHRIGRTGRAGLPGRAWMIATRDESKQIQAIERLIKKAIPEERIDGSGGGQKARPDSQPQQKDNRQKDARPHRERHEKPHRRDDSKRDQKPQQNREEGGKREAGFGSEIPDFFGKK